MQIPGKTLYVFISNKDIREAGLPSFPHVLNAVRKFFCNKLTVANKCPGQCNQCRDALRNSVTNIDPKIARVPAAVLVWNLRNARSRLVEVQHTAKAKKDRFGIPVEANYLDQLLEQLEEA
jgi:hypothetical protein